MHAVSNSSVMTIFIDDSHEDPTQFLNTGASVHDHHSDIAQRQSVPCS